MPSQRKKEMQSANPKNKGKKPPVAMTRENEIPCLMKYKKAKENTSHPFLHHDIPSQLQFSVCNVPFDRLCNATLKAYLAIGDTEVAPVKTKKPGN